MQNKTRLWTTGFLSLSFALTGCLKSGEDATGVRSEPSISLDAGHGGARIALPEIDPAALNKSGADTTVSDTLAKAWFQLSITGDNMPQMSYRFPLSKQGNPTFEIKGIPAGNKRSFHGSLVNGSGVITHDGVTLADIQGGVFSDVHLFLAKASGSASICVVIEGQKLPACATKDTVPTDTVPTPPKTVPGPTASLPLPGSGAKQTTLCMEMRFDYANSACEIQGMAKMDFLDGKILFGSVMVFDIPNRTYSVVSGNYDSATIAFYGVTQDGAVMSRDTLSLNGRMGTGATMAKGDYERLPSGKKGIWTANVVVCGSWTPKYPDASCSAVK